MRGLGNTLSLGWNEMGDDGKLIKPLSTGGVAGITFGTHYTTPLLRITHDFDGDEIGEVTQANGRWVRYTETKSDPHAKMKKRFIRFPDVIDHLLSGGGQPRLYGRPSFSGDERVFPDLASYAPGMNTSRADVRAVLEAEAAPRLADLSGPIDPAARKLIDRARAAGWQKLTVSGKDGKPALAIAFDGAGRYAYQHTLPNGLREQVVCDGRTLLHLYPDLGIGSRRAVSRFHRADFAGVVPWLVPPAEDLAHGTELTATDDPHRRHQPAQHAATARTRTASPPPTSAC